MDRILSISEAAKVKNVTRQAIYLAIKQKKLTAYMCKNDRWGICPADLNAYDEQRYSRKYSTCDGELIFDEENGKVSIATCARILGVPEQKLYYAVRVGKLRAHRRNAAWVVDLEDLMRYEETFLAYERRRRGHY